MPLTPLIGRETELEDVKSLLLQDNVRLLTLHGPAGSGKTRLALESASALSADFDGHVYLVSLAPVSDPAILAQAIAQAMDVPMHADSSTFESLASWIAEHRILIVLDNFEQLLPNSKLLSDLLASCPGLKILATSRVVLRLSAEFEYPVLPLPLPDLKTRPSLEALSRNPAVTLFLERARAVKHDFSLNAENATTVAKVCVRLDGLPLALELAAPWLKILEPADLLARLDKRLEFLAGGHRDLPARQRTIRSAIAWSYDLLAEQEKQQFQDLSVFAGGFTADAARAIWDGPREAEVLMSLRALVDANMLGEDHTSRAPQPRFMMLETIREFGLDRLEHSRKARRLRQLHAEYFRNLAERVAAELKRRTTADGLKQLAQDIHNFRAAMEWALANEELETGARIAAALRNLWVTSGFWREGEQWLEAFYQDGNTLPESLTAKVLTVKGVLSYHKGGYIQSVDQLSHALQIYRKLGLRGETCDALTVLGESLDEDCRFEEARVVLEEALGIARALGDARQEARILTDVANNLLYQGDLTQSLHLTLRALEICESIGDQWLAQCNANNAGFDLVKMGKYAEARRYLMDALALSVDLSAEHGLMCALASVAELVYLEGDLVSGVRLFAATYSLRAARGAPAHKTSNLYGSEYSESLRTGLPAEVFEKLWQEGLQMNVDEACDLARDLLR